MTHPEYPYGVGTDAHRAIQLNDFLVKQEVLRQLYAPQQQQVDVREDADE